MREKGVWITVASQIQMSDKVYFTYWRDLFSETNAFSILHICFHNYRLTLVAQEIHTYAFR